MKTIILSNEMKRFNIIWCSVIGLPISIILIYLDSTCRKGAKFDEFECGKLDLIDMLVFVFGWVFAILFGMILIGFIVYNAKKYLQMKNGETLEI